MICSHAIFRSPGPNGAGKSTFLSALSGKLKPTVGRRDEGDGLALGVFTQDLAQDLDQEATAVEVVTRTVRDYDSSLSDEKARSILGALGLTGEKSLRKVGHLSGGEKARVALASFVLIPHNLLLLDEPSNHLDVTTLEVLTKALREFSGSIVVISHDRKFLEELAPTHVITVRGGMVSMEERSLREDDWNDPLHSRTTEQPVVQKKSSTTIKTAISPLPEGSKNPEEKKLKANAAKKVQKIESSMKKFNEEVSKIDEEMLSNGKDRGKLMDLQNQKDKINEKLNRLYSDLEELIELI